MLSLNLAWSVLITASSVSGPGKCIKSSILTGVGCFGDFIIAGDDVTVVVVVIILLPPFGVIIVAFVVVVVVVKPGFDGTSIIPERLGNVPPQCGISGQN